MRRALVLGASGLVGSHIAVDLASRDIEVFGTRYRKREVDVRHVPIKWYVLDVEQDSHKAVEQLVAELRPDVVVNCIAWPWVDGCEKRPMRSHCMNRMIPTNLAGLCAALRLRYVFLSSAYVYGSSGKLFLDELDLPFVNTAGPVNTYGDDKLHAEVGIMAQCPHALIVRTVGVFGYDPGWKCFVSRLIRALKHGEEFAYFPEGTSNWTWAHDLASDIGDLLQLNASGVWHSAGKLVSTRRKFAKSVVQMLGLDESLLRETDVPSDYAPRAKRCVLSTRREFVNAYEGSEYLPEVALKQILEDA